jgi:hypothetical protein
MSSGAPSPSVWRVAVWRHAILAIAAFAAIGTACHGSSPPPPTTTPPTSPSPTATQLTAEQRRCVAEATFLIGSAATIVGVVTTQEATPGNGGIPAAIETLQAERDKLQARTLHGRFVEIRVQLVSAIDQMVAGYQGKLDDRHHKQDRQHTLMIIAGASAAATAEANLGNAREACTATS